MQRLRSLVILVLILVFSATLGCKKTTSVGSFVMDVPPGWVAERDGVDGLELRTRKRMGWVWMIGAHQQGADPLTTADTPVRAPG